MRRFLLKTYDFFHAHKAIFYILTFAAFAVPAIVASHIKVEEDISRSIPVTKQTGQINKIFSHSGFADKIVVKIVLTADTSPQALTDMADSFALRLKTGYGSYVSEIKARVNDRTILDVYNTIHNNLPIYLEERDYKTIDSLIQPTNVQSLLRSDFKLLTSPAGLVLKRMIANDPVGISNLALKKLQALQVNDDYDLYDGYIITKDRRTLIMFVVSANPPIETSKNSALIEGLDKITNELNATSHGASISYFGGIAVAVGNARQSKQDTYLTLSLTVVTLLLFIGFFFRRKRVPFIMMLPVFFGALFSLAIITISQGNISAIALAAGSIVLGIAINYSLHFFSHYKHCGSVKETIADLLVPMTIGSFTTVGSFFCLILLQSQILKDFGLFAGLSLTGATIFSLVFLPHLIPLQTENEADVRHESWFTHLPQFSAKYNLLLFLLIVTITIYLFPKAMNVGFDSDIANLNFMTPKLRQSEKNIEALNGGDSSQTVFIASTGKNMEYALQNNEALLLVFDTAVKQGLIKKYSSISSFIPSDKLQQNRLQLWNKYWTVEKKQQLLDLVHKDGAELKFTPGAFAGFSDLLNKQYTLAGDSAFAPIKNAFGGEYLISADGIQSVVNTLIVVEASRPKLYKLLSSNPSTVILDKKILTNQFIGIIYNDFNSILAYSSLLVFFALLFSYGRIELTVLTFLPMLISWIWILGIMNLAGIRFNIISIIISTFIFGIGDDFSIFITDGLTRKFSEGKETIASHKVSIFLSATTTIIGLGALIFAKHPAMHSIAVISIIGISCVVLIGQTIQPFLYNSLVQKRKERGLAPWTFPALILSAFAFAYFVAGALLLTLIGAILIYVIPFPKKANRKLAFHYLLRAYIFSLVYIMVNVRKVYINKGAMDFSKPAIIIANHQSFLDILVIVMQHPKLIMLTNKWTYNSPFFGKLIQMADYYPVVQGVDLAIEKFTDIVRDGYSIVIFPEGTRSADGKIKRFHKGAFYLAERLKLDIVPLLLHGTGDTMRKGDFMLFNGQITMKYLPRIKAEDTTFGENYAERTKRISAYFKAEYGKLKEEIETPRYFKQRIIMNYIYKGPLLEFYTRFKIRKENFYTDINNVLPKAGNVTVLGSGYGFLCYILHFVGSGRKILGIDLNQEKTEIARNCYSMNPPLEFSEGNVFNYPLPLSDAFVIDEILPKRTYEIGLELIKRLGENLNANGLIILKYSKTETEYPGKIKRIGEELNLEFSETGTTTPLIILKQKK